MRRLDSLVVVLAGLVGVVTPHSLEFGSCKTISSVQDFQPKQFEGRWHVIEISSTSSRCLTMNFTLTEAGFRVTEARELFLLKKVGVEHIVTNRGFFTITDPSNPARMLASWNINILGSADVTVVDTDYEKFAVLHECQSLAFLRRVSAVILSREKTLDGAVLEKVKNDLQGLGIDVSKLDKINHDNCKTPDQVDFNLDEDSLTDVFTGVAGAGGGQSQKESSSTSAPVETNVNDEDNEIFNARR